MCFDTPLSDGIQSVMPELWFRQLWLGCLIPVILSYTSRSQSQDALPSVLQG